jgi:hypothetical protein
LGPALARTTQLSMVVQNHDFLFSCLQTESNNNDAIAPALEF